MEEVLHALNSLVACGVIQTYAIGGAVGASFYIPAVNTEDVDAFVCLQPSSGGLLDLSPIYSELIRLGGTPEREFIRFGDWPLQVLPDVNQLVREAICEAIETDYDGIPTRVFRAEHLCCIALQTGRAKDLLRVQTFLEESSVDRMRLGTLAAGYDLSAKLAQVEGFLGD